MISKEYARAYKEVIEILSYVPKKDIEKIPKLEVLKMSDVEKEKLLEMYLQTTEYETEYSFPEMLDEFDERYIDALETDEKDKYQYPYLKILMDIQTVDENARKNPEMARETLQSCMKTCFNAYLKKLDNIQDIDLNKAKEIYSQIKYRIFI